MTTKISASKLTLNFPIYDRVSQTVRAQIAKGNNEKMVLRYVRALDEIDLDIKEGERVGLLGQNGAGKSTILRTFAGVYVPQSGQIAVSGSIASLFDVGVGIDQDASGYENIPLLMAAQGIPLKNINKMIQDVEEFTELNDALQRPLRTYSQGMRLRIAFCVATARKPDILLMDEVIGVGDADFREKSKTRISQMMEGAGTLVLASHSNAYLRNYCDRGIVMRRGKITFDGSIEEAIRAHSQN